MRRRIEIADRLEKLGFDPLEGMVRIAAKAEASGNLALAAKICSDMLQYMAPKLKTMELSLEPETMQFLDRQARQQRIKQLLMETGLGTTVDGEFKVLKHIPARE
jgi:hypothetical protein